VAGMPYSRFLYLWPPRPQTTIDAASKHFQAMKARKTWTGQLKLNGQRSPVYISPEGEVELWNRHGGQHRNYNIQPWLVEQIKGSVRQSGKWIVIDGELLHAKDRSIKNTLYWWDVLVFDGEYLIGSTYEDRCKMLREIVKPNESDGAIAKVTDNIWLAENFGPEQYDEMWTRTETSWVEGFVFKNLKGRLKPCIREKNNHEWQLRCRKRHGAYRF